MGPDDGWLGCGRHHPCVWPRDDRRPASWTSAPSIPISINPTTIRTIRSGFVLKAPDAELMGTERASLIIDDLGGFRPKPSEVVASFTQCTIGDGLCPSPKDARRWDTFITRSARILGISFLGTGLAIRRTLPRQGLNARPRHMLSARISEPFGSSGCVQSRAPFRFSLAGHPLPR